MHVLSTLSLGLFTSLAAGWTIQDDYGNDSSFFDKFTFYTDADPTNGFVQYVDQATASGAGLISTDNGAVRIGVNTKDTPTNGIQSVRISSNNKYSPGTLVVIDLAHMPGSVCGSWPAFWMLGSGDQPWPAYGEIDIIEGVNTQSINQMTLHTSDNCTIDGLGTSGTVDTSNCYIYAEGQSSNAGCAISDTSANSYGDSFNTAGGGVYATLWTSSGIKIWHWGRNDTPSDALGPNPNPDAWSIPNAAFGGSGCDWEAHFKDLQILFDITFCGDWAGAEGVFTCGGGSTCQDYVTNNAGQYTESYWEINSLKVYTGGDSPSKRDISEVPHAHGAQHLNDRRTNPHARPGPRPNRAQRREGMKLAQ